MTNIRFCVHNLKQDTGHGKSMISLFKSHVKKNTIEYCDLSFPSLQNMAGSSTRCLWQPKSCPKSGAGTWGSPIPARNGAIVPGESLAVMALTDPRGLRKVIMDAVNKAFRSPISRKTRPLPKFLIERINGPFEYY